MSRERLWGYWTQGKLDVLRDYLAAFAIASKKARGTTYLDLFAGRLENADKDTGDPFEGSVEIALGVNPPFSDLVLFELEHAEQLAEELKSRYPDRRISVVEGDCNVVLERALASEGLSPFAPTFAFIDPDGPDCWWTTLDTLARFRQGQYKTELWMLFPVGMFTRLLTLSQDVRDIDAERISNVFGTDAWTSIYQARRAGLLEGDEARFEYINLMRWRLEHVLGYKWTHSFDVRNSRGGVLYSMVFATDNETGNKIMRDVYAKAVGRFPAMAEEAKLRRSGQGQLFTVPVDIPPYEHRPPLEPFEIDP